MIEKPKQSKDGDCADEQQEHDQDKRLDGA